MTFSIVAKDQRTGAFGVATATGGPAVGSLVPYARAGTGAVATQGFTTNPFYGFEALELFANDKSAQDVLDTLTNADTGRERRQCLLIDQGGNTAAWTGSQINETCGSILDQNIGVAGNLLTCPEVLENLISAFRANPDQPIEDRLLHALTSAQAAGGDRRGTRSAALKVYTSELYPAVDIRVDWSISPITELAEILQATRGKDYAEFFDRLPSSSDPYSA